MDNFSVFTGHKKLLYPAHSPSILKGCSELQLYRSLSIFIVSNLTLKLSSL